MCLAVNLSPLHAQMRKISCRAESFHSFSLLLCHLRARLDQQSTSSLRRLLLSLAFCFVNRSQEGKTEREHAISATVLGESVCLALPFLRDARWTPSLLETLTLRFLEEELPRSGRVRRVRLRWSKATIFGPHFLVGFFF